MIDQWVRFRWRFYDKNVQACATDGATVHGGKQVVLIDDRAAADVDNVGGRFHLLEYRLIEHAPCLWGEGDS